VIRCPKCGFEPNVLGDTCLKCGAALEKKCGACGFSNSVEKNYCDQCGQLLSPAVPQQAPPPPPQKQPPAEQQKDPPRCLEIQSMQDAVSEKYASFRRHVDDQQPKPPPPPAAGPAKQDTSRPDLTQKIPYSEKNAAATRPPMPAIPTSNMAKKLTGPAMSLTVLAIMSVIGYFVIAPFMPKLRLTMTAKDYLTNMQQGKYEEAYDQLSANSKSVCSLEDYIAYNRDYYAKTPPWQFRDVQIFTMAKQGAMIKYQLKEGSGPWKTDYLSFVQEHDRWARPYIWMLFQPIDEAMSRQDFTQALFLAQKLYLTDPMDPRASGYLCASEFFMSLYDRSVESCSRTLEAAAAYPVGYTGQELYWFNLYYADSLRLLERNRAALDEYEKMLKLPELTVEQQCPIFLNRADVYVNTKNYEKALADVMRAGTVCVQGPSRDDALKRQAYMSGAASNEAIDFAKRSRLQPGSPPVRSVRRRQLDALAAKLGAKGARYLPKDEWLAVHLSGPEYRVYLRQEVLDQATRKRETSDIFVFFVNLWTSKGKVEKAPVLDPALLQPRSDERQ